MDELSLWIVIAQLINFWILFFIFKKFLWEKIVTAIEERRKHLKASNEAEDLAKQKIEDAEKEVENILENARKKAGEIEKSAEDLAKQNTSKTLEKASRDAEYIVKSAESQIEKDRLNMENSMRSKILDLSLRLSSKIFNKEAPNKDFLEKELSVLTK